MKDDITRCLEAWHAGEPDAFNRLIPLVQDELRILARRRLVDERPGHTLQPTALINEFYLRCHGGRSAPKLENRIHFFGIASKVMRRILVDHARRVNAERRGNDFKQTVTDIDNYEAQHGLGEVDILALDQALDRLKKIDPVQSQIVVLRFFGGLNADEIALLLEISARSVTRKWSVAKLWLLKFLKSVDQ